MEGVGALAGLLQGVPYGLKDVFPVPGYPTAWGLGAFRDRVINNVSGCMCLSPLSPVPWNKTMVVYTPHADT